MKKTEFFSEILRERYVRIDHRSGLAIYVFPKKMTTTYALFTANYGSVHNVFRLTEDGETVSVPDGVAHFLEHKLFENADGSDSFERFAALGADANAYTSCNRTSYLFGCTSHVEQSLDELLRFVTHPHFTAASVAKEQGIIAQEIREYEDSPWERCYQMLLAALYEKHPVRANICGTVESIAQITPEILYTCHRAFYNLSNMALVICGDVTPEQVVRVANRVLPRRPVPSTLVRSFPEEPPTVFQPLVEARMQVSKPIFTIGIKDSCVPADPVLRLRRDTLLTLLDEILFSRAGEFYNSLFESNLISASFSGGYSCAEGFGFHAIAGESDEPELVLSRLKEHLKEVAARGIDDETFARCRRVLYADELRAYDSTDEIANRLTAFVFEGVDMFSYLPLLQSVTKEEVEQLLREVFSEDCFAMAVVRPFEEKEGENTHE